MKKSPGMFSSIQMEYCHASAYDEWMPVKKNSALTSTERNHQGYRRWEKQMQDYTQLVDELLEKECYIIDYLPETVPSDAEGQFWGGGTLSAEQETVYLVQGTVRGCNSENYVLLPYCDFMEWMD